MASVNRDLLLLTAVGAFFGVSTGLECHFYHFLVAWSASPSVFHLPHVFYEGGVKDLRHSDDFWRQNEGHHRWWWPSLLRASNTYMYQFSKEAVLWPTGPDCTLAVARTGARSVYILCTLVQNACVYSDIVSSSRTQASALYCFPLIAAENRGVCFARASSLVPLATPLVCKGPQLGTLLYTVLTHYNYLCRGEPYVLRVIP